MTQEGRNCLMNWPEDYYRELDGDKRKAWLDQRIEEAGASRETEILTDLWELRYGSPKEKAKRTANGAPIDRFIRSWLYLTVQSQKKSLFGVAKNRKQVLSLAKELRLDCYDQMDGEERQLTDAEYLHLFRMIAYLESTDSGFTRKALGFMKLNNEEVRKKITDQFDRVLRELPKKYELTALFAPLVRAADQALELSFYKQEESNL